MEGMGKLARVVGVGREILTVADEVAIPPHELAEEQKKRDEERYNRMCSPVKTTVDLRCLDSLTEKIARPVRQNDPFLAINKDNLRFSAMVSEHFKDGDRLEILANKHMIAVRKNDKTGVACTKKKSRSKSEKWRPAVYISRSQLVRDLVAKGWTVGMKIPLEWDDEGQFWWGKKPKGAAG